MANKRHCDLCDEVLPSNGRVGGRVEAKPLNDFADGQEPMDLCLAHYNTYKYVVRVWRSLETGGTIAANDWPKRRTKEPK